MNEWYILQHINDAGNGSHSGAAGYDFEILLGDKRKPATINKDFDDMINQMTEDIRRHKMKDILKEIDYKQITKDYDYFFLAAHKKGEKEAAISAVGLHSAIFVAFGKYIKNMLNLEPQEGIEPMGVAEMLGCILVGMEDDNLTRSTVLRKDFFEDK